MQRGILIALALATATAAHADEPDVILQVGTSGEWTQISGVTTTDDDVILVGWSGEPGVDYDGFVENYDGTLSWEFDTSATGDEELLWEVVEGSTGFYVRGRTDGALSGVTNGGYDDAVIFKLDSDLTELAGVQFPDTYSGALSAMALTSTGVVISVNECGTGWCQAWVAMLDPSTLATDWEYDPAPSYDYAVSKLVVDGSDIYVAGMDYWDVTYVSTPFFRKVSTAGVEDSTWSPTFSFPTGCENGYVWDMVLHDGYLYTAGQVFCSHGGSDWHDDMWIERRDVATGAADWTTLVDSGSGDIARGLAVRDDGVYVGGYTYGDLFETVDGYMDLVAFRLDPSDGSEDTTWQHQFGTTATDFLWDVELDESSSMLWLSGSTGGDLGGTLVGTTDGFAAAYYLESPGDLVPETHDLGEVEVGDSSVAVSTLTNTADLSFEVSDAALADGTGPWSLSASQTLPYDLAPGETLDLTVTFAPTAAGTYADTVEITTDLSSFPLLEVDVAGEGVSTGTSASDEILEEALDLFDDPDAELVGTGPGSSAEGRKKAMQNKLEAIGTHIEDGDYEAACGALASARKRVDGESKPPDFVSGADAATLLALIDELLESLGCS